MGEANVISGFQQCLNPSGNLTLQDPPRRGKAKIISAGSSDGVTDRLGGCRSSAADENGLTRPRRHDRREKRGFSEKARRYRPITALPPGQAEEELELGLAGGILCGREVITPRAAQGGTRVNQPRDTAAGCLSDPHPDTRY
ncbi:hypothetical protein SKAU_G00309300 [Synaphobranchus kaupii]|uniref:Uncharacterized protein n=1 Tax=Synaphobranchus kaupii TaxID=118154 RepID=A0A9Q1IK55_SYNKA|nr:hypothetical protein SKAU_G00309300 [Synaphobranchus kaupii]